MLVLRPGSGGKESKRVEVVLVQCGQHSRGQERAAKPKREGVRLKRLTLAWLEL